MRLQVVLQEGLWEELLPRSQGPYDQDWQELGLLHCCLRRMRPRILERSSQAQSGFYTDRLAPRDHRNDRTCRIASKFRWR